MTKNTLAIKLITAAAAKSIACPDISVALVAQVNAVGLAIEEAADGGLSQMTVRINSSLKHDVIKKLEEAGYRVTPAVPNEPVDVDPAVYFLNIYWS